MSQPNSQIVKLSLGLFEAEIAPYGAHLIRFRRSGRDLILGLRDVSAHLANNFYAGAIVGPVANRITDGKVQIDGHTFQMERNEDAKTALHSGSDGLHHQLWEIVEVSPTGVTLSCNLPDGHAGLPGNREITVNYQLNETGLCLKVTATTDKTTPINIAHHPYWALEPDQSQTHLTVHAATFIPTNESNLPTGEQTSVIGTSFDFNTARTIGPNTSIDHNWCLGKIRRHTPRPVATVRAQDGLQLDIETTETGLQVYTGAFLPTIAPELCNGPQIMPNAGIALEPQGWPDAPNQTTFPSILIEKGEIYQQITRYSLSQISTKPK